MAFHHSFIALDQTRQFSSLFLDYIQDKHTIKPFFSWSPTSEGYKASADAISYPEDRRKILIEAIREQYAESAVELPQRLVELLRQKNALTVCTGHQLCLFTGPLFFMYKLISTIKIAQQQTELLNRPVVPIYWMASEDHDIDEIRSIQLYNKTISWNESGGGAVGRLKTDSLQSVLDELSAVLGTSTEANELMKKIRIIYAPNQSLAEATRRMVHELFGDRLLVLDPDDTKLKREFLPIMQDDLVNGSAEKAVFSSIQELEKAGYEIQVNPRAINLFLLGDNSRDRIERVGDHFQLVHSQRLFSHEEILQLLDKQPELFSPNVVLRPLYQQLILPNIAYIGGPGELAYWLEYRKHFEETGIHFPVLQPRLFATIIDKSTANRLEKLNLNVIDLFEDSDQLLRRYVQQQTGETTNLTAELEALENIFSKITSKAIAIDSTLKGAADSLLQQQRNAIGGLETKMLRAAKQKEETSLEQIRKLREKVLPGNVLQERTENILPLWLKYGMSLMADLEEQVKTPITELLVLTEKS